MLDKVVAELDEPEVNLWRSVLMQSVTDATSRQVKIRGPVVRWIHTADFIEVCHLAGVEPTKLKPLLAAILLTKGAKAKWLASKLKGHLYHGTVTVC
jgi:hypothetical protein